MSRSIQYHDWLAFLSFYVLVFENLCAVGALCLFSYDLVNLVFPHLGFWSGNLFLIAPFPDLCLLVPFCTNDDKSESPMRQTKFC